MFTYDKETGQSTNPAALNLADLISQLDNTIQKTQKLVQQNHNRANQLIVIGQELGFIIPGLPSKSTPMQTEGIGDDTRKQSAQPNSLGKISFLILDLAQTNEQLKKLNEINEHIQDDFERQTGRVKEKDQALSQAFSDSGKAGDGKLSRSDY